MTKKAYIQSCLRRHILTKAAADTPTWGGRPYTPEDIPSSVTGKDIMGAVHPSIRASFPLCGDTDVMPVDRLYTVDAALEKARLGGKPTSMQRTVDALIDAGMVDADAWRRGTNALHQAVVGTDKLFPPVAYSGIADKATAPSQWWSSPNTERAMLGSSVFNKLFDDWYNHGKVMPYTGGPKTTGK